MKNCYRAELIIYQLKWVFRRPANDDLNRPESAQQRIRSCALVCAFESPILPHCFEQAVYGVHMANCKSPFYPTAWN